MTTLATAVRVGISGELYVTPTGSTAPTTSVSSLDAAFIGLGYVSDDGVTITPNDSTEGIIAWQYAARVRTVFTEKTWTFQCSLIESKGKVAGLYYANSTGPSVVSSGEWSMLPDQTAPDQRAFVFDIVDGSKNFRYYIPNGEVTERGEQSVVNGDALMYDITITANYSSTISAPFKIFTNDTNWGYS